MTNPAGPDNDKDAVSQFNDPGLIWASAEQAQPAPQAYGQPGWYQPGEYYRESESHAGYSVAAGRPRSRWPLILAIVAAVVAAIAALVVVIVH